MANRQTTCALLLVLPLLAAVGCRRDPQLVKKEAIQRGDQFLAKNRSADAVAAYGEAVDIDPGDGHIRMKLSDAYAADQRWDDALNEAVHAAELLPGDFDAEMMATTRLLGSGHYLEALIRSTKLLEARPDDPKVLILSGNAVAHLLNSSWALFKLPDLVNSAADFDAARATIRPPVPPEDDAVAERRFRRALELEPDDLEAQQALVSFLWASGQPDKAEPLLLHAAEQNPGHAGINYPLGKFYMWRGRNAEAERYLKNAAATGKWGIGARFALADLYLASKRYGDVIATLAPLTPADDEAGAVSLRMAPAEFRTGKHEAAMKRINAFIERQPQNARARLLKAQFLVDLQEFDDAVPAAREAVTAAAESSEAHLALGRALAGAGELDRAFDEDVEAVHLDPDAAEPQLELTSVALALGRDREALQFARDAVRHLPDNADAVVLLSKVLVRAKDFAGAERELTQFMVQHPATPQLFAQLGVVFVAKGNSGEARKAFETVLKSETSDQWLPALSGLVTLDLKEGKVSAARQRIEAAAQTHSNDPAFLLIAAKVYRADKDAARTESTLRQLTAVQPGNVDAAVALSDLLVSAKREDEARRVLEQAIQKKPGSWDAETALASLLERTGHTADARASYEKIVARYPKAAFASYRLAAMYMDKGGDLAKALDLANSAKRLLPDDPGLSSLLGRIHLQMKLPGNALPYFEDAVRAAPDKGEYRYELGFTYVKTRNYDKARVELTRAPQLDPACTQAAEARAVLKDLR